VTASRTTRRYSAAFTLIEVLIVVAIIGLAGAIVVPAIGKMGSLQIQAASRIVIADLIYAQNEAVAHQAVRKLVFDDATGSYKLTDADGNTLSATWKNGNANNFVVSFKNDDRFTGVDLSTVDFGGAKEIEFDALGTPSSGGTVDLVSGSTRYRVSVAAFTGRITVAPVTAAEAPPEG
jgi:prepilin-type N-terminal cleavage/methylation domain-containing protein